MSSPSTPRVPVTDPPSSFARARVDSNCLGELLERYRHLLFSLVQRRYSRTWNPIHDSDVVQETLLVAVRHFHSFRGQTETELASWLGVILRRITAAQDRRARRR